MVRLSETGFGHGGEVPEPPAKGASQIWLYAGLRMAQRNACSYRAAVSLHCWLNWCPSWLAGGYWGALTQ